VDTSEPGSISRILVDMKRGDEAAAEQLWSRVVGAVAERARKQLAAYGVRGADQEDVAVDVFASLCTGAAKGRFPRLEDRQDLWQILMMLTRQKVIDRRRKRAPDWTESALNQGDPASWMAWGVGGVADEAVPADLVVAGTDTLQFLLDSLDDTRRTIALLRMDGYSNAEIAQRLGTSLRSVERKVGLIKAKWQGYLEHGTFD
jgi:DNA-directed RNA polymerase specialized sigma24 family protein